MTATHHQPAAGSSLLALLALLRRRWLLVLLSPVVLVAVALVRSHFESPVYQGQADVLLSGVNLQETLDNQASSAIPTPQFLQLQTTQAALAMSSTIAERVVAQAHAPGLTPTGFLNHATVVPAAGKDFLYFQVTDDNASRAEALSQAFAQQYVVYQQGVNAAPLQAARAQILHTLRGLNPKDPSQRGLVQSLTSTSDHLLTLEALQSGSATYLGSNTSPSKVQPRAIRDAIIALLVGLIAGVGLAFLRDATDTRVRTPDEVGEILGLQYLGYLPPPPKPRRGQPLPLILQNASSGSAEAFRKLAVSLEFMNRGTAANTIMVSSAVEMEGKSVTICNLAVMLAKSGRSVALVDFDLRKPTVHKIFGLASQPGITDAVLGQVSQSAAGHAIELNSPDGPREPQPGGDGKLLVFTAGTLPTEPAEFLGTHEVQIAITQLSSEFDYVLLDAPPLGSVSDPLILSSRVGALFIVARIGALRRPAIGDLKVALKNARISPFGFVATGSGTWLKFRDTSGYA